MQLLTIEVLLLIPTMLRYSSRPSKNVAVQGIKNKLDAFISVIVNNMLLNIMWRVSQLTTLFNRIAKLKNDVGRSLYA